MPRDTLQTIQALLARPHAEPMREGLALARRELARVGYRDARPLLALVASIFHVDPEDRPDLADVVEEAYDLVAGLGPEVVPVLLEDLAPGDLKEQLSLGEAFSRMGPAAIAALSHAYRATDDPVRRTVVVHALGKIASPEVTKAAPVLLEAAVAEDLDLRDNATRALGRLAGHAPPGALGEAVRAKILERLRDNAHDQDPGVRAVAVWGIGQLGRHGHLRPTERQEAYHLCLRLLGRDERFEWDLAYVVRQEADAALAFLAPPGA